MSSRLASPLLAEAGRFIDQRLGLHFPSERIGDLERGLQGAAREFGFSDLEACVRWLMSSPLTPEQVEVLAGNLTVGETYFLRDARLFEVLETVVLPELFRAKRETERRLRIWSAGCCTGEEPYSLAIALRRLLPDLARWNVSILGTDINARFLQRAAHGVYGDWSFRDTPEGFRETNFTPLENRRWQIAPALRAMVNFAPLNLVADVYPALANNTNGLDLVICRNVLIYFSAEQTATVIRNLSRCLVEGGWLILAPSELPHAALPNLVRVQFGNVILCRKQTVAAPAPVTESPPADPGAIRNAGVEPFSLPPRTKPVAPRSPKPVVRGRSESATAGASRANETERSGATRLPDAGAAIHALANEGRLAEALARCDELVAADKLSARSHYLRASLLQEQGRGDEAVAAFQRAIYLEPDFVLAHFAWGNAARAQGKAGEAERHFRNASRLAAALPPEMPLPEAEGLTAGRLVEIITKLQEVEAFA